MTCIQIPNGLLSVGGADHRIAVRGKTWTFEWNEHMGPFLLSANGKPLAREPNYVLEAIGFWAEQGKQIKDGLCVWDRPREPDALHVAGRVWVDVGPSGKRPRLPAGFSFCPGCERCNATQAVVLARTAAP